MLVLTVTEVAVPIVLISMRQPILIKKKNCENIGGWVPADIQVSCGVMHNPYPNPCPIFTPTSMRSEQSGVRKA